MKETPIAFQELMAQAVWDDRKGVTRRICDTQPPERDYSAALNIYDHEHPEHKGHWHWFRHTPDRDFKQPRFVCPYGKVGDRLWVREPYWQRGRWVHAIGEKTRGGKQKWCFMPEGKPVFKRPAGEVRLDRSNTDPYTTTWHKRLARYMPRKYSRMTLQIVSIRLEWLHDITDNAAWDEGCGEFKKPLASLANLCHHFTGTNIGSLAADDPSLFQFGNDRKLATDYERVVGVGGRGCFAYLWESINGQGSWAANPAVWVIGFRKVGS